MRYFLLLTLISVLSINISLAQNTDIPEGMEQTAQQWCMSVKAGWNLGNTFECAGAEWINEGWEKSNCPWSDNSDYRTRQNWETAWGNPSPTEDMIKAVSEAGFNAIRIPVRWEPHVMSYETMEIDPVWMAKVKQTVDWCMKYDMYVLLNIHHEMWLEANPYNSVKDISNDRISKLWTQIATTFKDYDGRLAFAGINEVVHDRNTWGAPTGENNAVVNSYHQTFVDAVRATGGNNTYRNLVVQTYSCNPDYGMYNGLVIPTDVVENRLSVEFHYYQPWEYAGSGEQYWWNGEDAMRNKFKEIANKWWKQGLGIVVGEYGCVLHYDKNASPADQEAQKKNNQHYFETITRTMYDLGFAGFVWDNNAMGNGDDVFGIFDRKNGMKIWNQYAVDGIAEGAYLNSEAPDRSGLLTPSGGTGGEDDGEGTLLDWEKINGRIFVPQSEFADLTAKGAKMKLEYALVPGDYCTIKFERGDWGSEDPSFNCNGMTGNEFSLGQMHGTMSGSYTTEFAIPEATLTMLKTYGLIIYGHGVRLKSYSFADENSTEEPEEPEDPDTPNVPIDDVPDNWYVNAGNTIWSGNHALDWGGQGCISWDEGNFASLTSGSDENMLVLYYKPTTQNPAFEIFTQKWWGKIPQFANADLSNPITQRPAANDRIITLTLNSETTSMLKQSGLLIQGQGMSLNGLVVIPAAKLNSLQTGDADANGEVNVADVIKVLTYLSQKPRNEHLVNKQKADANESGSVESTDIQSIADLILVK